MAQVGLHIAVRLLVFAGAFCLQGCKGKSDTQQPTLPVNVSEQSAAITDEEAQGLFDRLVDAAEAGSESTFVAQFDLATMIDRSIAGLSDSPEDSVAKFADGAKRSVVSGLTQPGGIVRQVMDAVQKDGSFRLLRINRSRGATSLLTRVVMADDAGLNYLELFLDKPKGGSIQVVDIYTFAAGDRMSSLFRRGALEVYSSSNRSFIERLTKAEGIIVRHREALGTMSTALRNGDYSSVVSAYQALPEEAKSEKLFLLTYVNAASRVSDTEYQSALSAVQRHLPNDASIALLSIDFFINRREFDAALNAVSQLDKAVGGDPYLDTLRAGILMQAGRTKEAADACDRYLGTDDPTEDAYWVRISIALKAKDFDITAFLLDDLHEKFGVEFKEILSVPEYAEFRASSAGQAWMLKQKQGSGGA